MGRSARSAAQNERHIESSDFFAESEFSTPDALRCFPAPWLQVWRSWTRRRRKWRTCARLFPATEPKSSASSPTSGGRPDAVSCGLQIFLCVRENDSHPKQQIYSMFLYVLKTTVSPMSQSESRWELILRFQPRGFSSLISHDAIRAPTPVADPDRRPRRQCG